MKTLFLAFGLVLLAGCASQDGQEDLSTQDMNQAIADFIDLRELESVDSIRSGTSDGWTDLTEHYILYRGRSDTYLVEFVRRCTELNDNTRITPDVRHDANLIRARFDTIRGCRIRAVYALTDAEVVELENIGETPGERS